MLMKLRSQMQRTNNQKGFTLVELMVVVVIIGILIAIAVPIYRNIQSNAATNACKATQRSIEGAYQVYRADAAKGTWPDAYITGATGSGNTITVPNQQAGCEYTMTDGDVTCSNNEHK